MMTLYLSGVVCMAIAILYSNYRSLSKLYPIWAFWVASLILCLSSWLGILILVWVYIKNNLLNKD